MPWRTASGRTVPWRSASELSRLRLKRPERLMRPDTKDAIFFFLIRKEDNSRLGQTVVLFTYLPESGQSRCLSLSPLVVIG